MILLRACRRSDLRHRGRRTRCPVLLASLPACRRSDRLGSPCTLPSRSRWQTCLQGSTCIRLSVRFGPSKTLRHSRCKRKGLWQGFEEILCGEWELYVMRAFGAACFSSVSSLLSSLVANGRTNSIANLSRSAVRAGRRRRGTNGRARLSQTALCALVVGLGLLSRVVAVRSGWAARTRVCRAVKRLALLTRNADRRAFDVCDRTLWARLALGAEVRRVW